MKMTSYQVNVAGESFAASVLSHAGYDVAIQFGTTQPDWDLVAVKENRTLKVSVKGSQKAGWGLFQSYKEGRTFHEAVDEWFRTQPPDIVFCLITYCDVPVGMAPRCYLARPAEIVTHMRTTRGGHGQTSLHEDYTYKKGMGKDHQDKLPEEWKLSQERIDTI